MYIKKEKLPKYLLIIALIYVTIFIFIQNFIFSSDFTVLSLRSVDEVAFQGSLYKYHDLVGGQLLFMNDYGYGWIYWFPLYVLTYPAYLLFKATGVSWLLIVLPRMYSLFFCIMCSVLSYKIISIYTQNEWIKMAVVFMMPLFPMGSEWAGRFSTVPQVAFFSMLSIYLVVKNETLDRRKLRYSLLAFATAMATKVSAVVTAPLLVLLILARYKWKFNQENLKVWIQESFFAILLMIVLMCPIIVFSPLYPNEARGAAKILLDYWTANQNAADIISNFKYCIRFFNLKYVAILLNICLVLLGVGGGVRLKKDKENVINWDYILFPIGYYIGIFYLSATISSGNTFIFMYATSISFIMPFGILVIDNLSQYKRGEHCIGIIAVFCFLCQILTINSNIRDENAYHNIFRHYQNGVLLKEKEESLINMEKAVEQLQMPEINYYVDWVDISNFYSIIKHDDNIGYCQTIWDDLGNLTYDEINLIALSKSSVGFYDEDKFEEYISNMEFRQQEQMKEDRKIRLDLVQNGRVFDSDWMLVYEDDNAYIFRKIE